MKRSDGSRHIEVAGNQKIKNYFWFKALSEHLKYGARVYDYDINQHDALQQYRFEQMGQILQDYFLWRESPHNPNDPVWMDKLKRFEEVIYATTKRS